MLAAFCASFALLAALGVGWGWRAFATSAGMALGYGSAYAVASWVGPSPALRVVLGLLGAAAFGVCLAFFTGFGTVWGSFLYGLGFALLLAVFRGLAPR